MAQIKTFKDLKVWKKSHQLALAVYKATSQFPQEEKFGLISQMRRAAVSVPSNIVEGFRRRTTRDSLHFYNITDSSLEELKYQILLSLDLQLLEESIYKQILNLAEEVSKMLHRWKYCCRTKPTTT